MLNHSLTVAREKKTKQNDLLRDPRAQSTGTCMHAVVPFTCSSRQPYLRAFSRQGEPTGLSPRCNSLCFLDSLMALRVAWQQSLVDVAGLRVRLVAEGPAATAFGQRLSGPLLKQELDRFKGLCLAVSLQCQAGAEEVPPPGPPEPPQTQQPPGDGSSPAEWEVVPGLARGAPPAEERPAPATAVQAPVPAEEGRPAASTPNNWEARLDRARKAGHYAGEKLAGVRTHVPPTPPLPPPCKNRYYVVLRARPGALPESGVWPRYYGGRGTVGAQFMVEETETSGRTHIAEEAIFHGFASRKEVTAYCEGAGRAVPEHHP